MKKYIIIFLAVVYGYYSLTKLEVSSKKTERVSINVRNPIILKNSNGETVYNFKISNNRQISFNDVSYEKIMVNPPQYGELKMDITTITYKNRYF